MQMSAMRDCAKRRKWTVAIEVKDVLAVFGRFERDILRDRVKAGIDQARSEGKPHGRPKTAGKLVPEMKQLCNDGICKRAIAKQLGISRTSVIRLLSSRKRS